MVNFAGQLVGMEVAVGLGLILDKEVYKVVVNLLLDRENVGFFGGLKERKCWDLLLERETTSVVDFPYVLKR